jgi:flagellin
MGLSIFTSGAAMSSTNALNKSNSILSTAMERLGTGKRINSAADDAAGLQIATRLQGQVNGMSVAKRNVSDATTMLQTAEGAFDEVTNILYRMKDIATQGANSTNGTQDRDALQAEVDQLNAELKNILGNTKFGGENLIFAMNGTQVDTTNGKLTGDMSFQIGASKEETLEINLSNELDNMADNMGLGFDPATIQPQKDAVKTALDEWNAAKKLFEVDTTDTTNRDDMFTKEEAYNTAVIDLKKAQLAAPGGNGVAAITLDSTANANEAIDVIANAIDSIGAVRSSLGANINRLGHTAANLANMQDNTSLALGNIRDADFATEATNMTRNQMLAQTSMSMLKQANSMSGMVMSLLG